MKQMDAVRTAKIYELPAKSEVHDTTEKKHGWFYRRAVDIGAIGDMASPQNKPFNWTIISTLFTIFVSIFGGIYFVYNQTWSAAYKQGQQDLKMEMMQKELEETKRDAKKATQLQIMNESPNSPLRHDQKEETKKK